MIQLFMDTSYKTMTIAIIKNDEIVSFYHEHSFKTQSELAIPTLDKIVAEANIKPSQIDEMIITLGPGSYTGVRIAMSIAKTLSAISDIRVKTITSLELFVSSNEKTLVVFDARSDRAYFGLFYDRLYIQGPAVLPIDDIKKIIEKDNPNVVGDGHLFDTIDNFNLNETMLLNAIKNATLIDDVDHLKPLYLKEMSAY